MKPEREIAMREMLKQKPFAVSVVLHSSWRRILSWFKDDVFRRLVHNAGWLLSSNGIATLLGLLGTILKARALGPESFGLLAVIMAYTQVVGRFFSFQPWQALIKYGAEALQQKRYGEFMGYIKLTLILDVGSCVIATLTAVVGVHLLSGWQYWNQDATRMAQIFSLGLLFGISAAPIGILRLLDHFKELAVNHVVTAVIQFLGVVIVYWMQGGIWGFLMVTLISGILSNIFLVATAYWAIRKAELLRFGGGAIVQCKPFLIFSGWTYLTSSISIPIKQLDVIIASMVISLEAAGIYKIIKQYIQFFSMMIDPIYQAVYPQFSLAVASGDERGATRYAVKIGIVILLLLGPMTLLTSLSSVVWLPVVLGADYGSGWLPMTIFAMFALLAFVFSPIHPLFLALGYAKRNTMIALVSNAIYLVGAICLGKLLGLVGLGFAYGADILVVSMSKSIIITRKLRRR